MGFFPVELCPNGYFPVFGLKAFFKRRYFPLGHLSRVFSSSVSFCLCWPFYPKDNFLNECFCDRVTSSSGNFCPVGLISVWAFIVFISEN